MKIHICARKDLRDRARRLAAVLKAAGHQVVSRWLYAKGTRVTTEENAAYALNDLLAADCVVLFAENPWEPSASSGACDRHVEFGYALRAGKRACVLGPRETTFCHLPKVEQFRTSKELLRGL